MPIQKKQSTVKGEDEMPATNKAYTADDMALQRKYDKKKEDVPARFTDDKDCIAGVGTMTGESDPSLKKGLTMAKKKEITKVPDKEVEKVQDSSSLEYRKINGKLSLEFTTTEKGLFRATGFHKHGSAAYMLMPVLNALAIGKGDLEKRNEKGNQLLSTTTELSPRDGFEGMLIGQMLVTYEKAMECFRLADCNKAVPEMYYSLQNQIIKLMRLHAQQLEALDKHRNKGKQTMVVEHVNVHQGGQAIVGNVNQEGGRSSKIKS